MLRFAIPADVLETLQKTFDGTLILNGGYDATTAEAALATGKAQLISFGRPYVGNPDLVSRFAVGAALNESDDKTFFSADEKGFTDYPVLATV